MALPMPLRLRSGGCLAVRPLVGLAVPSGVRPVLRLALSFVGTRAGRGLVAARLCRPSVRTGANRPLGGQAGGNRDERNRGGHDRCRRLDGRCGRRLAFLCGRGVEERCDDPRDELPAGRGCRTIADVGTGEEHGRRPHHGDRDAQRDHPDGKRSHSVGGAPHVLLSQSAPRSACSQSTGSPAFVSTSFNISPFVAAWATTPSPYPRGARLHLLLLKRT